MFCSKKKVFHPFISASLQTEESAAQQEDGAPGRKKRKKKKKKAKGDDTEAEAEEPAMYQEPPKFEVNKDLVFISKAKATSFVNVRFFHDFCCCLVRMKKSFQV